MATDAGVITDPPGGAAAAHRAVVFTGTTPVLADGFETDSGWTLGASTAAGGSWERVIPNGTVAAPPQSRSGPGTRCWVTGQGTPGGAVGQADVDAGLTTLVSPAFDLSAFPDAVVSYWRWYSNGTGSAPFADSFRVDVSLDGGATWTNAETLGPGHAGDPAVLPGWRRASWRFADLGLAPSAAVRVRFVAEDAGSPSIIEAAIDDFSIDGVACDAAQGVCCRGATCTSTVAAPACTSDGAAGAVFLDGAARCAASVGPPPCCVADYDKAGGVGVLDILAFLSDWFANRPTAIPGGDGSTGEPSLLDIFTFLTAWFAGCP